MAGDRLGKTNSPVALVVTVYERPPDALVSVRVAAATG